MDRLKQRLTTARRALSSFRNILREPKSDIVRDASIQRFEYTFEAMWKAAQLYLRVQEGLEVSSPKAVIRASGQAGLLASGEVRRGLDMVDDRNLTVHTYNEALAETLSARLPAYVALMDRWLGATGAVQAAQTSAARPISIIKAEK